jgi:hypothetical protein
MIDKANPMATEPFDKAFIIEAVDMAMSTEILMKKALANL